MASLHPDPELSIVVPVWGDYARGVIAEALESLRGQAPPARIVVVDNASEPSVGPLAGVEVIRSEQRLTVGAARNLGLDAVATPYVVFWDADDLMLPGTLARLLDQIRTNPGWVAVAAAIVEGDPPRPHGWPRVWARRLARHRRPFALCHSVWSLYPSVGSTVMRTDAVRAAGGYADSNSGEDWVLGAALAFRGQVVLDEQPGRLYGSHAGALRETLRSPAQLAANARNVRGRIRSNGPVWARNLLPLIALLQIAAIQLARTVRAIRTPRRS